MAYKQGGGTVTNSASITDNAIVRGDGGANGIQSSVPTIDDTGNISQSAAVSGASLSIVTANTSNTASATAYHEVQVAGSTASDAYFKADISGGQNWTFGLDNSDSDAFVVAASTALGTTNTIRISTSGEINYPLQPACLVYNTNSILNVTGDATLYTVAFDAEIYDQNSDYNTGTATFTAPVTGVYTSILGILFGGLAAGNTGSLIEILASNRTFTNNQAAGTTRNNGNQFQQTMSVDVDMDAADTITFAASVSGGTKIVDIVQSTSTDLRCYASVRLVC